MMALRYRDSVSASDPDMGRTPMYVGGQKHRYHPYTKDEFRRNLRSHSWSVF